MIGNKLPRVEVRVVQSLKPRELKSTNFEIHINVTKTTIFIITDESRVLNLSPLIVPNEIFVDFIEFHKDTVRKGADRSNVNNLGNSQSLEDSYFATESKLSHTPDSQGVIDLFDDINKILVA